MIVLKLCTKSTRDVNGRYTFPSASVFFFFLRLAYRGSRHDARQKSHANLLEARVVRTLEAQTKTENIATYEEPVAHPRGANESPPRDQFLVPSKHASAPRILANPYAAQSHPRQRVHDNDLLCPSLVLCMDNITGKSSYL